jgi:hypothetical protein
LHKSIAWQPPASHSRAAIADSFQTAINNLVTNPAGEESYTWARNGGNAINNVARSDGWTAKVAARLGVGPMTKEAIASKLAQFTDEELQALGLSGKKGKK